MSLRVARGLAPGQVLQRRSGGARVEVSGSAADDGAVHATIHRGSRPLPGWDRRRVGRASGGRFTAILAGLPPGGPYRVTLACGGQRVEVPDVFVGDLWLLAGQSNMEGCARLPGAAAPHPLVRCFTMGRRWEEARDPLHLRAESPDAVHGEQALDPAAAAHMRRRARGGGVGIAFARRMLERSGVPQGLIAIAHGGTSMAQWDPALAGRGGASLYGSLRLSLAAVGQPIAGVLWAQGESEALPRLARVYTRRMRRLVAALRRDLGQPRLPWLLVQAGRFIDIRHVTRDAWPDPESWNSVQEQQRLLPSLIPGCAIAASIDLTLDDCAHLDSASFALLAERLAEDAARLVLRDRRARPGPQPGTPSLHRATATAPACIVLPVRHAVGGLRSAGPLRGFALVDRAGREVPAIARADLDGDRVVLRLAIAPRRGLRLRYGLGLDPACTLRDGRGLALPACGPLPIRGL